MWTHISFAGAGGADVSADVQVPDEAVALRCVDSGSERQRGTILRRGKLHLSQIVDEEVEFGGNAAETRLDQPERHRDEKVRETDSCCVLLCCVCVCVCVCVYLVKYMVASASDS